MEEKINKKIEAAMRSLDGIGKASPAPFFFTRLEAGMLKEKSRWEEVSSFIAKPAVVFACICLVIMINAMVIFSSTGSTDTAGQQSGELATVDEYNEVNATFFDFVNTNP